MTRMSKRTLMACLTLLVVLVAVPSAGAARGGLNGKETKLLRAINSMRAANGLHALTANRRLAAAADAHSLDMGHAGFFAHNSSDGTDPMSRIRSYVQKNWLGETLAYMPVGGNSSARKIFRMWMNSPPHKATLMTGNFRRIGIARRHGQLNGQRVVFWTADFTSAH